MTFRCIIISKTFLLSFTQIIHSFIHFFFLFLIFIYLAVLGLSCSVWDLELPRVESSSLTGD